MDPSKILQVLKAAAPGTWVWLVWALTGPRGGVVKAQVQLDPAYFKARGTLVNNTKKLSAITPGQLRSVALDVFNDIQDKGTGRGPVANPKKPRKDGTTEADSAMTLPEIEQWTEAAFAALLMSHAPDKAPGRSVAQRPEGGPRGLVEFNDGSQGVRGFRVQYVDNDPLCVPRAAEDDEAIANKRGSAPIVQAKRKIERLANLPQYFTAKIENVKAISGGGLSFRVDE